MRQRKIQDIVSTDDRPKTISGKHRTGTTAPQAYYASEESERTQRKRNGMRHVNNMKFRRERRKVLLT